MTDFPGCEFFADDPPPIEWTAQWLARRDWELGYQLGCLLAVMFRQSYRDLGYGHLADFCKEVFGYSYSSARRLVELAEGVGRFQHLRESFAEGRLCPTKIELLLVVLKKSPEQEKARVEQAERLGVRALREALKKELPDEPDLVYFSAQLTGKQVLRWRQAHELGRVVVEAAVPRGETLEYAVAEFLSGEERPGYEEVLVPERRRRERRTAPGFILKVALAQPSLPDDPAEQQALALRLIRERQQVALEQGNLLIDLVVSRSRQHVGQFAEEWLGLSRLAVYARMAVANGAQRYPGLARLTPSRAEVVLRALDEGVDQSEWLEFAAATSLPELRAWVRHVRWQKHFCFQEFLQWTWRAPNPGERPDQLARCGVLPTLTQRPVDAALVMVSRMAVRMLEVGRAKVGLEEVLPPVRMLEDEVRKRVGWMVPRDFYPVLMEGLDVAADRLGDFLWAQPGECLEHILKRFCEAYQGALEGKGKRHRVKCRDGHCCSAPGCTARGKLQQHHIVFRSQGGSDDMINLALVCLACHGLIHEGKLRVTGVAPDGLTWTRLCEVWVGGRRVCAERPMSPLSGQ